jgi:hypothetical protein
MFCVKLCGAGLKPETVALTLVVSNVWSSPAAVSW